MKVTMPTFQIMCKSLTVKLSFLSLSILCLCLLSLKALANKDTLLLTQMFSRLPAHATFVADTNFVSGTQKNVSGFVQKHFVSATNVSQFAQPMGNNVSATMCPRLPGPLLLES